jgi:cyclase
MLRPRIIPCLLLHDSGLVKTQGFKNPKYVGDPINAVKIFNEKEADELIVLDIDASIKGCEPNFNLIAKLAAECQMPLCYGGGISTLEQAVRIIDLGVEKVALSAAAIARPSLLTEIANVIGSQSVVAVLDVRKKMGLLARGYEVFTLNGKKLHKVDPVKLARELQDAGAGEILINSIDNDGSMKGYDINLALLFKNVLKVPLTILGGVGSLEHMRELVSKMGIIGLASGSFFVFKGKYRAVLISYPTLRQKLDICSNILKQ